MILEKELNKVKKVKEVFVSIQGEGPYIGYKQLFIRLCGCNMNCAYCDTDFSLNNALEYSTNDLVKIVSQNKNCHSVSLTGGEPLLHTDFIKKFAPKSELPVYLETNGILYKELKEVISDITYIAADIKLPSATNMKEFWYEHEKFFEIASQKELFAKAVFDKNITESEIYKMCNLCKKFDVELILQPMMRAEFLDCETRIMEQTLASCIKLYQKVRLIPQMHKFIGVI